MTLIALLSRLHPSRDPLEERAESSCVQILSDATWSGVLRKGDGIICRSGILWLTQSGDFRDHILRAGQSFAASRNGKVVVTAIEDAKMAMRIQRGWFSGRFDGV